MKNLMIAAVVFCCLATINKVTAQNDPNLEKEKKEAIQRITNDKAKKANAGDTQRMAEADDAIRVLRNVTSLEQLHRAERNYNAGLPQETQPDRRPTSTRKVKKAY